MKTTKGKTITPQQLRALHTCFGRLGFDEEERHGFIGQFTNERVHSTKELTFDEALRMLSALNEDQEKEKKKISVAAKKVAGEIYGLSLKISFLNKDYPSDNEADFEMNKAKINVFARSRSAYHKNMTAMSLEELKAFKNQLEAILNKEKE